MLGSTVDERETRVQIKCECIQGRINKEMYDEYNNRFRRVPACVPERQMKSMNNNGYR